MRVVASISARMGSTRLPGKSLRNIEGKPLLAVLLHRLRKAINVDEIVLATTTRRRDDKLAEWAKKEGIGVYRGSETDVLSRLVETHTKFETDVVVRVCGDTPLIDPNVIDWLVYSVRDCGFDFAMNAKERAYPHGIGAHVCRFADLKAIHETYDDPLVREHSTLPFYENPKRYKVAYFNGRPEWWCPGQRLQVDYQEDIDLVRAIVRRLGFFATTGEIVKLLRAEPKLREINAHCEDKPVR